MHHRFLVAPACYNMVIIEYLQGKTETNAGGPNKDLNVFMENLDPLWTVLILTEFQVTFSCLWYILRVKVLHCFYGTLHDKPERAEHGHNQDSGISSKIETQFLLVFDTFCNPSEWWKHKWSLKKRRECEVILLSCDKHCIDRVLLFQRTSIIGDSKSIMKFYLGTDVLFSIYFLKSIVTIDNK